MPSQFLFKNLPLEYFYKTVRKSYKETFSQVIGVASLPSELKEVSLLVTDTCLIIY